MDSEILGKLRARFSKMPKAPKEEFYRVLRILLALLIIAVILFLFALKPQKSSHEVNAVKPATFEDGGLDINHLVKIDKSFKEDHISTSSISGGFTSPYGYYYYDKRQVPEGKSIDKKHGLLFYDYKTHKSSDVNCRISKDSPMNDNDIARHMKVSPSFGEGAFYKDKLYLISDHMGRPDDGFDLYRGSPDGTDLKKIYTSSFRTLGESVYCNNKVYFSLTEHLPLVYGKIQKKPSKAKIVSVDLDTFKEETVAEREGFNACMFLMGYYKDSIYYTYQDNKKIVDSKDVEQQPKEEDNVKENSVNALNLTSGKSTQLTPKVFMDNLKIEKNFIIRDVRDEHNYNVEITNLDSGEKTTLSLYEGMITPKNDEEEVSFGNVFKCFDGKNFYYTNSNSVTDDMNVYDFKTHKLSKFTPPKFTDKNGDVNLQIRETTSGGFIFEKYIIDPKTHQSFQDIIYFPKDDYYAGKASAIPFE